jgi:hypothetical protein
MHRTIGLHTHHGPEKKLWVFVQHGHKFLSDGGRRCQTSRHTDTPSQIASALLAYLFCTLRTSPRADDPHPRHWKALARIGWGYVSPIILGLGAKTYSPTCTPAEAGRKLVGVAELLLRNTLHESACRSSVVLAFHPATRIFCSGECKRHTYNDKNQSYNFKPSP